MEIMDVTLREATYVEGNCIDIVQVKKLVQLLHKANIDYIEVGYLNYASSDKNMTYFDLNFLNYLTENKMDK
ncbi:hypothetical protein [Staphylococcus sp. EZ-P03]|uniref:hypothetical protein n=1 Tax=Staphylococcus sp. EZ-P03 TaxID=2282739 RepID=UPI000DF7D0DB|nr:hypothetical protein [Staphylococcus sp. EZ-P03]